MLGEDKNTDLPIGVRPGLSSATSQTEELPSAPIDEKAGNGTNPQNENESLYPEGGWKAWSVVLGSFLAMVTCFGIMNTIGTLQSHLATDTLSEYSQSDIGWIFGLYSFLCFFGGIQIGPIFDAFGPLWLLICGTVSLVAGMLLASISTKYWQYILTFGVLNGLGGTLMMTPAVASIGHWFLRRRGYATGVAMSGGSVGGIIYPLIIQGALPTIGFNWGLRIIAFIMLGFSICAIILIRARTEVMQKAHIGDSSESDTSPDTDLGSMNSKMIKKLKRKKLLEGFKIDLTALKDPRFTLTTLGIFLIEWGVFVPLTYIVSNAIAIGISTTLSFQILAFLNVGSLFGRWLPGILSDKIGRFNMMIITMIFCLVMVLGLWLPAQYVSGIVGKKAIMILFALLYGFGSGTGISLSPVCVGQICETKDYGKRYGTCYFFVSFGTLTGIPVAGEVLAADNGSYVGLILFSAGAYIAAVAVFMIVRVMSVGPGLRKVF